MGDESAQTIRATLARLGVADTALGIGKTILHRAARTDAPRTLPTVTFSTNDLVSVREIGRGGIGVVHLAQQRSIGREVAVKVATSNDTAIVGALVREACIMGSLEHPNLVPLHSLGVDADGAPMLVMKRVDGVTWRELIDSPSHDTWAPLLAGHGDRLRAQVEILVHVCRALAFAHDRGVIHRDLKPENVMIGRFGEVYVLDWGSALRLADRETEPPALVGTPGYLAPEMAHGDPKLVDVRTDVYLLGATLFEVLAGRMPHDAPTAVAALVHALGGEIPALPASVPRELAHLVTAAMAKDKSERPASVEAFRESLARFLVSRDAAIVAADARAALERSNAISASEGLASTNAFRSLVEARFGFTSALRLRPDDASLRAELDASIVRLAERELELRSPGAARALLADLADAPKDLLRRVEALEADVAREQAALQEHAETTRQADTSKMARPFGRTLTAIVAVAAVFGSYQTYEAIQSGAGFPVRQAVMFDFGIVTVLIIGVVIARRALLSTAASRRVVVGYVITAIAVLTTDMVTFLLGHNTNEAAAHTITLSTFMMALFALNVRRLWIAVAILATASVCILLWLRYAPLFALVSLSLAAYVFVGSFRTMRDAATPK